MAKKDPIQNYAADADLTSVEVVVVEAEAEEAPISAATQAEMACGAAALAQFAASSAAE